ncbi:MAG: flippase-like domain-containing protein [Myxococcales bacterium]|nr:flippase-like domain-containing protein [Myxococcales bacterium]
MSVTSEPRVDTPQVRSLRGPIMLLVKLGLAAALVGWLVHTRALDFGALRFLVMDARLFVANLAAFIACSVVLSTARWWLLLRTVGVRLPVGRATALQMMALFFNVAIPGNIGGDFVKALYVARDQGTPRAPLLLLVAIERVLGLLGLVFMASIAALARPGVFANAALRPTLVVVLLLAAGGVVGPVVFALLLRWFGPRADPWLGGPSRVAHIVAQLVAGSRLVLQRPLLLLLALLCSMAMHGVAMAYFTLLTRVVAGHAVDYGAVATVFPIGLLTTVLPLSPAGMGVGHVAFDRLYQLVGLTGGATVFNVFLLGQLVPCTVGVLPYLMLRIKDTVRAANDEAPTAD